MTSNRELPESAYAGIKIGRKRIEVKLLINGDLETHKLSRASGLASWFEKLCLKKNIKVISAALIGKGDLKKLGSELWLNADIVPLVVDNHLQKDTKELALFAASQFVDGIARIKLGLDNKVQVRDLVTLDDYKKITPSSDFKLLLKLSEKFRNKRIVYFSATPRGGGVALMRHALMRLYKLLDVDASWHVMQESPEVFQITKKKFHNVLHGIADPDVRIDEKDKKVYLAWIKENAKRLQSLFHQADVIVVDDPQPSGLVPHIRKMSPKKKIIYRSHIQLETSLFDNPENSQCITWNFIWDNIKTADLFVSHPVSDFVPSQVDRERVVLMTAAIDRLDGLSKPLTNVQMDYYLRLFDNFLIEDGQTAIDKERPVVIQVARFDPSKGIPDVLEAFKKLRERLSEKKVSVLPQLVITGQGSVDDPEGLPILKDTLSRVRSKDFEDVAADIKVVRTPAIDQIQNVLMREARIYLQLSHKEGFEDKISGSLLMGVPAIIYKAGGMPLQVVQGKSGFIVEVGDFEKVAEHMFNLLTDKRLYKKVSEGAQRLAIPDATMVSNAINWLYLANEIVDKGKVKGNMKRVYDLARSR